MPDEGPGAGGTTGNHSEPTQQENAGTPAAEAYTQGRYADEKQHRADESAYWRGQTRISLIGTILAGLATGGALLSACLSGWALVVSQQGTKAALDAARQAERQAVASEGQLSLSKDTARAGQTPVVSVSVGSVPEADIKIGNTPTFHIAVTNAGPGFAYKASIASMAKVLPPNQSAHDLPTLHDAPPNGQTFPPSQTSGIGQDTTLEKPLSEEEVATLCYHCADRLVVFGDVTFLDKDGRTYQQDFCFELGDNEVVPPNRFAMAAYRRMEFCPSHQGQSIREGSGK